MEVSHKARSLGGFSIMYMKNPSNFFFDYVHEKPSKLILARAFGTREVLKLILFGEARNKRAVREPVHSA